MQCKAFKSNKMTYPEFKVALGHIAELLGVDVDEVVTAIIASQGPLANNITLPKYIKAHDDKDAWTGAEPRFRAVEAYCRRIYNGPTLSHVTHAQNVGVTRHGILKCRSAQPDREVSRITPSPTVAQMDGRTSRNTTKAS
jgi:hypothetical protein